MKIREIVNKIHLILGLASGAVVVVVALTGCFFCSEAGPERSSCLLSPPV